MQIKPIKAWNTFAEKCEITESFVMHVLIRTWTLKYRKGMKKQKYRMQQKNALGIEWKWQLERVEYKKEWRESRREMWNIQRQIKCMPKGQECHLAICGEMKAGHLCERWDQLDPGYKRAI